MIKICLAYKTIRQHNIQKMFICFYLQLSNIPCTGLIFLFFFTFFFWWLSNIHIMPHCIKILVFSSTGVGQRACHGLLSVVRASVRPSVRVLTFSLNIFFSETIYWILMKFYRNVPAIVLFRLF